MTDDFGEKIADGVFSRYEGHRLVSERSEFQKIDVYDHPFFGRVLTLDDLIQTTRSLLAMPRILLATSERSS